MARLQRAQGLRKAVYRLTDSGRRACGVSLCQRHLGSRIPCLFENPMPSKRSRSKPIPRIRFRKASAINVTRAEFDAVIELLNKRGEIINALHQACRDLGSQVEKNRQTLEIQFTRIAQLQVEIDALKRRA